MRILVVDDVHSIADSFVRALRKRGDDAEAVYSGGDAIQRMIDEPPDLILTDMNMEPIGGFEVLEQARAQRPPIEVIMFTGVGGVDMAVRAMQLGARDFLTKPISLDQLADRIDAVRGIGQPAPAVTDEAEQIPFFDHSPASRELRTMLERAAQAPSHVWIEGEIGSGRGQAATTLHRLSKSPGPLVTMEPSRGMEWPSSGTVVLSNVDDLPDDLQRDLVRQLSRVSPSLRIFATAGPESDERVAKLELRPDLYFKLGVIKVSIPPLRDRREDILPMLHDALARYARRYNRPVPVLDPGEESRLLHHTWPGNVRELLSVAERAVVLGADALKSHRTRVAPSHLPVLGPNFRIDEYMDRHLTEILEEALRIAGNQKKELPALLGATRQNIDQKLIRTGLAGHVKTR